MASKRNAYLLSQIEASGLGKSYISPQGIVRMYIPSAVSYMDVVTRLAQAATLAGDDTLAVVEALVGPVAANTAISKDHKDAPPDQDKAKAAMIALTKEGPARNHPFLTFALLGMDTAVLIILHFTWSQREKKSDPGEQKPFDDMIESMHAQLNWAASVAKTAGKVKELATISDGELAKLWKGAGDFSDFAKTSVFPRNIHKVWDTKAQADSTRVHNVGVAWAKP